MSIFSLLEHNFTLKRIRPASFGMAYNILCAYNGLSLVHSNYSRLLTFREATLGIFTCLPMKIMRSQVFQ